MGTAYICLPMPLWPILFGGILWMLVALFSWSLLYSFGRGSNRDVQP
jgi:hypothetical protein